MTYDDAITAAQSGQRVTRPSFGSAYVSHALGAFGRFLAKTQPPIGNARRYVPTDDDQTATDWEVLP